MEQTVFLNASLYVERIDACWLIKFLKHLENWKNILQFLSQTHLGTGVKLTLSNICAIISLRQDQAPRLPSRWKCAHRLTLSGDSGTVRTSERRVAVHNRWRSSNRLPGEPAAPKWCLQTCRQSLQLISRSLFLVKTFWHNYVNRLAGCCRWHPGLVAIELYYRQSSGLFRYPEIRIDIV